MSGDALAAGCDSASQRDFYVRRLCRQSCFLNHEIHETHETTGLVFEPRMARKPRRTWDFKLRGGARFRSELAKRCSQSPTPKANGAASAHREKAVAVNSDKHGHLGGLVSVCAGVRENSGRTFRRSETRQSAGVPTIRYAGDWPQSCLVSGDALAAGCDSAPQRDFYVSRCCRQSCFLNHERHETHETPGVVLWFNCRPCF